MRILQRGPRTIRDWPGACQAQDAACYNSKGLGKSQEKVDADPQSCTLKA